MKAIERLHESYASGRRVRVLAEQIAALIPERATLLDVGCGDGRVDRLIGERRSDVALRGIDVQVRADAELCVEPFDGIRIPHADRSFDVVLFVDVLHHCEDPMAMLREAARVARRAILIKDHTRDGLLAGATLRFMDRVGNARHDVALPYNYWPRARWMEAFRELGLELEVWRPRLPLFPPPASWVFGRGLHFVARLGPAAG